MAQEMIFVTGYFGARIREEAERIASRKGWPVLDLDRAIEESDGRSIARLCMMGGEHAYRNAEYEQVAALCGAGKYSGEDAGPQDPAVEGADPARENGADEPGAPDPDGLVIACGDGILYDEDTRALILEHQLVIAGEDRTLDELWEQAKQDVATYHAFMKFGTEEEKRAAFEAHHGRQEKLFALVRKEEIVRNEEIK